LSHFEIHKVEHLNDGQYGNQRSWVAAREGAAEWAQIELPAPVTVNRVVFSRDRKQGYRDRSPTWVEVRVSLDGQAWKTVARAKSASLDEAAVPPPPADGSATYDQILRYACDCERLSMARVDQTEPVDRVLGQMEKLLERLAARGIDVAADRAVLLALRQRAQALGEIDSNPAAQDRQDQLYFDARLAKRNAFFRDPELSALQQILFVKRHPFLPSHNYSDLFDWAGRGGGGVCVLDVPFSEARLQPERATVKMVFDAKQGVVRDPMLSCDASRIYFSYTLSKADYFHLHSINADGSDLRVLTEGPFHDTYPLPLPDGGLALMSTRCRARYLCWRPQSYVLFRMDADGRNLRPLSFANISEWAPTVTADGRILWTRSEYLDKGADFGHTLWTIRPDGTHPELLFGNNTLNCYVHAREVPDSTELVCTIFSHGGDLNGPIGLLDPAKGRFDRHGVQNITPDVPPHYHMQWPRASCFRDPAPISRDLFLVSHAPQEIWGLYVIDRYGNRELLYMDPAIGCMAALPMKPRPTPPVLRGECADGGSPSPQGTFYVADVYQGLGPNVKRGSVKYLRVCQEVRADLERLPSGEYRQDHPQFTDFYASPVDRVNGPCGWPTYVAKAVCGTAPVEEDGSASFLAPAGKVLYFQALDESLNEIQRMRSVVQLQPGERRGCVGCHEDRMQAAPRRPGTALRRKPSELQAPPWGAGPFAYEKVVQPVWNAHCARCHGANDPKGVNLSAQLDEIRVPASYRTLISQGWVNHFNCTWGAEHAKAEPMTFGTLKSRLISLLEKGHYDVRLTRDELHRVKCWIDLNCPLWPDYKYLPERPLQARAQGTPASTKSD